MKTIIYYILLLSFLSCCNNKRGDDKSGTSIHKVNINENKFNTLGRMRIHNSPKILYSYFYSGAMTWSDFIYGKVLIDSTEIMTWEKTKNQFPHSYIVNLNLNSKQIDIIKFIEDNSEIIDKGSYTEKNDDVYLNVKQYFCKEGDSMDFFYHYHNLSENDDSIFFDRIYLDEHDFGLDVTGKIGFRKGNIIAREDSLGYVTSVKLRLINQNPFQDDLKKYKSVKPKPFNGISETDLPPLSKVYIYNIVLKPDSLNRNQKISDYGIYKEVKNK